MIKNVIFDMGNVLIDFKPMLLTQALGYTGEDRDSIVREVFYSAEWVAMDRGTLSQEEGARLICRRLPQRLQCAVKPLIEDWWKEGLSPIPGMEALIGEIKTLGYKIYLLSNATSFVHEYFVNIPGSQYFDGKIVSADWKMLKPEREIYQKLYDTFNIKPEESFFIDDLPSNIESAARTGMSGAVFFADLGRLRRELNEAGVKVSLK